MKKLIDRLVEWWMHRCKHNGGSVTADILDGEFWQKLEVSHCKRCGAARIVRDGKACDWHNAWPTDNA